MYFIGVEHGTRGVRCALLPATSKANSYESNPAYYFEIERGPKVTGKKSPVGKNAPKEYPSLMRELERRVDIHDILLGTMTYSMGDAFTEITDIGNLTDRGIQTVEGAGTVTGLGGSVFDELRASGIPMMNIPGVHRGTPTLLPTFRRLTSHICAPDKVCSAYQSSLFLASQGNHARDFILCDVGANTVSLLIKNGSIVGGVDAALGAPGLLQGPIDLDGIRSIDGGKKTANEVFSSSGFFTQRKNGEIKRDPSFTENYEVLISAVAMEINGLLTFLPEPEAIILTGSAPSIDPGPFHDTMASHFRGKVIHYLDYQAGALGGACIARDIHNGSTSILGVKVEGSDLK